MDAWRTIESLLCKGQFRRFAGSETWALTDQSVVSATNLPYQASWLARYMGLRGVRHLRTRMDGSSVCEQHPERPDRGLGMMSVGPKQEDRDRPRYFWSGLLPRLSCLF